MKIIPNLNEACEYVLQLVKEDDCGFATAIFKASDRFYIDKKDIAKELGRRGGRKKKINGKIQK